VYVANMLEDHLDPQFAPRRMRMVEEQLKSRDICDPVVLAAMSTVARHLFVPADQRESAHADVPLAIGFGQTISQPYIVASMTQALALGPNARVLEIGTGSGYQSAILAEIASAVYTIELIPDLHLQACDLLARLGYKNITARVGDGYDGWPEAAPFDGILVAASPPRVPPALLEQLAPGGHLVIPISLSASQQELRVYHRTPLGIDFKSLYDVRFVPMRGAVDLTG
jgi:protein-L-isoaspartate(D-aspartate) O-methyltransferase